MKNKDVESVFLADRIDRHHLGAHDIDVRRLDGEHSRSRCETPSAEDRRFVDQLVDELRSVPLD